MKGLTLKEYIEDILKQKFWGTECHFHEKYKYRRFNKLTQEDKDKFNELKKHEGEIVLYQRGKKQIEMIIILVTNDKDMKKDGYSGYPYEIRLNYVDGKLREWSGFWTSKIDKITIKSTEV